MPTNDDPLSEDLVLNFALIDSETNKVISDRAPSDYLGEIAGSMGTEERDHILHSHVIEDDARQAMLADEYEAFVAARAQDVSDEIARVTGKTVAQDED